MLRRTHPTVYTYPTAYIPKSSLFQETVCSYAEFQSKLTILITVGDKHMLSEGVLCGMMVARKHSILLRFCAAIVPRIPLPEI